MYLLVADEGYFGVCVYLTIPLDVMFFMTTEVVKALYDSINKFGSSVIESELGENITTIVKVLLVVCTKLSDIYNLPSKSKFHVLVFFPQLFSR